MWDYKSREKPPNSWLKSQACGGWLVKAWCLTVWRILEYTLCIIAYTLISLAGIHSSGIRVTWFWFSASKKHPSGVVRLTGAHIVQSMENSRYLDDFIQPSLHYDLHKQTTQNSRRDSNCSTAFAICSVCSSWQQTSCSFPFIKFSVLIIQYVKAKVKAFRKNNGRPALIVCLASKPQSALSHSRAVRPHTSTVRLKR